jgi:hypothetical protein
MSVADRVPAYLLLGLVLVASGLLLAGYGAPVAIGLITGLLLGGAVALAFLAMQTRQTGHSSISWLSTAPSENQPDQALIQRHGEASMRVAGVDASALRRLIPVGETVEAGGARVELVGVELRDGGGIATLVAHSRPPVGFVGQFVEIEMSDDADTAYVVSGQGNGTATPGTSRYEVRFAPTPPGEAQMLAIRISSFMNPFPGQGVTLDGPWEFGVEL